MTTLRDKVFALREVETPSVHHPESNQFSHTVQVVRQATAKLHEVPVGHRKDFLTAAVLHDVGKVVAVARNGTTHGHEADSVDMIQPFVNEDVLWLVKNHLRIMHLDVMRKGKREALTTHPLFPVLRVLRECDLAGRKAEFELTQEVLDDFLCVLTEVGL